MSKYIRINDALLKKELITYAIVYKIDLIITYAKPSKKFRGGPKGMFDHPTSTYVFDDARYDLGDLKTCPNIILEFRNDLIHNL